MEKRNVKHNDATIIKHYNLYTDYKDMCKKTKDESPHLADCIARSYYYEMLSKRYNLTHNYVCSIICGIMADEENFKKKVRIATYNLKD